MVSTTLALAGIVLWGIGFGAQDTLLKAIIAGLVPQGRRSLAFGLFYAGYGGGSLLGSIVTGLLYAQSIALLIAFSVGVHVAALFLFAIAHRAHRKHAAGYD